jgi:tetratricopeptide (TPR) repeat protein
LLTPLAAAPMIPPRDDQVLEVLPLTIADVRARELRTLRNALTVTPTNLTLAAKLAGEYIEIGRITGDPRYGGYAQSALAPWWDLESPPIEVLLLRAQLRQRAHKFAPALRDLDQVLSANPREPRARLQRATIRQVIADYAGARADCAALAAGTSTLLGTHCRANVMSVTGELDAAYAELAAAVNDAEGMTPVTAAWVLTTLAELATRSGQSTQAESHFRAALSLTPDDQYLLMAYADFLLALGRAAEVIDLVAPHIRVDGLLLRYALALRDVRSPKTEETVAQLRARFAANAARQETAHKREEARFVLEFENDPMRALTLARENWAVQKEPADLRILVACAQRAKSAAALGWRATGFPLPRWRTVGWRSCYRPRLARAITKWSFRQSLTCDRRSGFSREGRFTYDRRSGFSREGRFTPVRG